MALLDFWKNKSDFKKHFDQVLNSRSLDSFIWEYKAAIKHLKSLKQIQSRILEYKYCYHNYLQ